MSRPIQAVFDAAALAHNYQLIRQRAPTARAFAVIKANAYGHGVDRVVAALPNADGFAILEIETAIRLRQNGVSQPILLLEGVFRADELIQCAHFALSLAIHDPLHLSWLETQTLSQPVSVFVKLNTGMNRLGFPAEDVQTIVARLKACSNVAEITLMTHFATADEPQKGIAAQYSRFNQARQGLDLPISLANSAAIFAYPATHGDWVRPGVALYGASPFAEQTAADLGLQAVMSLRSEIIAVQSIQAGESIGYGAMFTADHAMRVGIVACGYADGYPRHAPSGTPVWVAGHRTQLLGRVSMDMLCVDLTSWPELSIGSSVELWGAQLPIDDVAHAAGTISYELMCAVTTRVPVYSI